MTKYEVIITESAKKDLKAIERVDSEYVQKIIQKIEFCLGEYLFAPIKQCNKKKLKGRVNTHRLHVQRKYTVFYKVMGAKDNRFAQVHLIVGFEAAHQMYPHIDL
ncbi:MULTISPECIES: type II toxin-antitoxin system RelE family toxin [unclassified Methanoculleus]|jgi:addiction module RelE/StbE family toxin|uniref:Type II toxin-antitoxin system mRNA interferase toxin, RelE/StbE family n=1 Tax=Methanoculleus palmolei TaxID=72612 RepID=A0ABD8A769_9EURY|nr:type II toxin-antitoxin system mRNA interferase toxin, RelE/StbE family [Methanoculleus sp. UBA377]WOX55390.1 type II toxin-antitoxin system mRNA interferase toxin, RelE/StbE family [Methanoculleus palmolei]WOX56366.1 type II toxin-antitoxin system mRNA interferase toxin, RelE/StbE family [Methanoculleus palmolei]